MAWSRSREKVLCYAVSKDGVNWEKPDLGLVEFNGSKHNNIVDLPQDGSKDAAAVIYEPEECDPEKRFKLAFETVSNGRNTFCVAFSPDGLRWTPSGAESGGRIL